MFIVRKKALAGPAPTLLWGYGGFNLSYGLASLLAASPGWVKGGVFVLANIRGGGGECNMTWHDGERLANKQNVFDDFIGAGSI